MERDFWQRYTGGVTEEVLDYLDEQGCPQERGGVEEVSGGRWTKGGDGVGKREETRSSVAEVKVAASGTRRNRCGRPGRRTARGGDARGTSGVSGG